MLADLDQCAERFENSKTRIKIGDILGNSSFRFEMILLNILLLPFFFAFRRHAELTS